LDNQEWGTCIALGSTSLWAAVVLKALPSSLLDKFGSKCPSLVNEDEKVESKVLQSYKAANDMKIPGISEGTYKKVDEDQDEDQKQEVGEDEFPEHN